ncbi:hypothetical protein AB6C80_010890 [Vibrio cyclitrophicus]
MSRKSRSKSLQLDDDFYGQPTATVEPLHLSELKLKCDGVTSHIDQLVYKDAPNYSQCGEKIKGVDYIPVVSRERFVRDVYQLIKTDFNRTKRSHFNELRVYIRWLDSTHREPLDGDYFHPDLYNAFMDYYQEKCNRGETKLASWHSAKKMLSFFLRIQNRTLEAKALKSIKGIKKETESHKGIDVAGEFRPLVRCFIAAFSQFRKDFLSGIKPEIHPLWNEQLFKQVAEKEGWSVRKRATQKSSFKRAVRDQNSTRNHFSQLSAILAFCFTGQNTTPILNLRFSDVRFTQESCGKIYFDMTKARAKHLGFDTSLGFHKKTQEFFHYWVEISKALQKHSGTDWVFPYFMASGDIKSFVEADKAPQRSINKFTKKLGLAHITPSILRQTKIDTLMKVTEDIYLVSTSANNDIKTIQASYAHGNESDHKRSLAASNEALYDVVKNGTNPHEAASQAKYSYADVLSDYDYKRLRKEERENDVQTPLGVRCKNATKGAANTVKKNLEKMGIKQPEEKKCTDFLGCFECEFHRLVSEVEDIWLMMSFNDTLQQMKDYPAINSLPTDRFHKLCNTIQSILTRFKAVSSDNYIQAQEMHNEAPHPLYSDGYSLMDLLEAF